MRAMEKGYTKDSFEISSLSKEPFFEEEEVASGSTKIYENGQVRCIPMPTADPKDPLNLPRWRVVVAIFSLCLFGAFALATEVIIGSLSPIFALYYSGIDPHIVNDVAAPPPVDGKVDPNPLNALNGLPGPPLSEILLLTTLPLLTNGLSNYFLVPLAMVIGRRPVLLLSAAMAFTGGLWAGLSRSLVSHIAARCFQGLGAGSVEAVIPLVIQDIVFIHKRSQAISMVWAFQGLVIVSLGIASPQLVSTFDWRTVYFVVAGPTLLAFVLLYFYVPESRWKRSSEELAGKSLVALEPGQVRPALNPGLHGPRTWRYDLRIWDGEAVWKAGLEAFLNSARSFLFPNVFWMILINSVFLALTNSMQQVASPLFLAKGFDFKSVGIAVLPIAIASPLVFVFSGYGGDKLTMWLAKKNGGQREPEMALVNLIPPMLLAIIGCFMFGAAGSNLKLPISVLMAGLTLIGFGTLSAISVTSVYVVEAYPEWAGPVLTNVSSFRSIFGFFIASRAADVVTSRGYLGAFSLFAFVLAVLAAILPFMYIWGKPLRMYTYRWVRPQKAAAEGGWI